MWRDLKSSALGLVGVKEDPATLKEQTLSEELSEMTSLTAKQRLGGFFLSLIMGITFIVIALGFVPTIALFGKKFAFFFTCGNFFCVASTAFIVGLAAQIRGMFEAHRSQAALAYVSTFLLTLISALYWRSSVLSIIFSVAQVASVLWYALSYIPFARRVVGYALTYAGYIVKPILSAAASICCTAVRCCFGGGSSSWSGGGGGGGSWFPVPTAGSAV
jgi:hypothetical protein